MTGSIRIKICGITDRDDAQAAVDAGADLIGLNFVESSPRMLGLKTAVAISERVEGQVERLRRGGRGRDPGVRIAGTSRHLRER